MRTVQRNIIRVMCGNLIVCGLVFLIVGPFSANAATITVDGQALAANSANLARPYLVYDTATGNTDTHLSLGAGTTTASGTHAEAVTGSVTPASGIGGSSYSRAYADIDTGELKAIAQTVASNADQQDQNSAYGEVSVSQNFDVSGTGTVQAFLALDGSIDLARYDYPNLLFNFEAHLRLLGARSGTDDYLQISSGTSPFTQNINQVLIGTWGVQDGDTVTLIASLLAQISSGTYGTMDFNNTAELFLQTDGVTLTPDDSRFLENPVYNPNVTPLPGTLPLFASGLGAMGLLGWRRKRRVAAKAAA